MKTAIINVDGLIIASALPQEVKEDREATISAAILSIGERISSELGRSTLEQVFIKGEYSYVILIAGGQDAVLTVLAKE